jgi:N-formylglutamate amidohydrolase
VGAGVAVAMKCSLPVWWVGVRPMSDPRLEDHAVGIELQIVELVEQRERARVQGDSAAVQRVQDEIDALQAELASTAEQIVES